MTEQTQVPPTPALAQLFNALDRCDRCGAQAYMRARLEKGTLLFCGHHGNEYRAALIAAGAALEESSIQ